MKVPRRTTSAVLLVLWLGAFAVLFLPWGDFQDHTHWYKVTWVPFSPPVRPGDAAGNVLAFVPFGLLTTLVLGAGRRRAWVVGIGLAMLLAFGAEVAQLYSHMRFPSATDLVANVVGAALGVWLAHRLVGRRPPPQSPP